MCNVADCEICNSNISLEGYFGTFGEDERSVSIADAFAAVTVIAFIGYVVWYWWQVVHL